MSNETVSYNFGLLKKLKWPSQVESNLSPNWDDINKQNTTYLEDFQRLNDIFHHDTFAEIRDMQCNQNKNRYRGILGCSS